MKNILAMVILNSKLKQYSTVTTAIQLYFTFKNSMKKEKRLQENIPKCQQKENKSILNN